MQDTRHTLFDNFGCGPNRRAVLAKQMESGEHTFCDVSNELYASSLSLLVRREWEKGSVVCMLLVFVRTPSGTVITQNNAEVSAIRRFKLVERQGKGERRKVGEEEEAKGGRVGGCNSSSGRCILMSF
jgi:hypothetical protein